MPAAVQQVAEQQTGRAGADDGDLSAHSGYVSRPGSEPAGYAFSRASCAEFQLRPEYRPPAFVVVTGAERAQKPAAWPSLRRVRAADIAALDAMYELCAAEAEARIGILER